LRAEVARPGRTRRWWSSSVPARRLAFGAVGGQLDGMDARETWEILSYMVTVIGLPFAIAVFIFEQRRERQSEEEEIFQRLSDEYREFLKLVLDNSDLHLLRFDGVPHDLTEDQK
jgi:hypothetical protein